MGKIILNDIEYGIGISNGVNVDTTNLVEKDSIVTTLDDTVTDEQIPTAKAVHTAIQNVSGGVPADVYSKTEVDDLLADKADSSDIIDSYTKDEVDNLLNAKVNADDVVDAYSKEEVNNLLNTKADSSSIVDAYTKSEVDALLTGKADSSSIIDAYNKTEVDDLLADKVNVDDLVDAYSKTEVNDLLDDKVNVDDLVDAYTKEEVDNLLDSKVNTDDLVDSYSKDEVDDLLANKANSTDIIDAYTKEEVNTLLDGKVSTDDVIDAYSKTEVDNLLDAKANSADLVDAYSKTEVNNLLANKADSSAIIDAYTKTETDDLLTAKADTTTLDGKVDKTAIVTSVSSTSTDTEVPSAKAVYNELDTLNGKVTTNTTNIATNTTRIYGIPKRNILINGEFQVNKHKTSVPEGNTATRYVIDRWATTNSGLWISANRITNSAEQEQINSGYSLNVQVEEGYSGISIYQIIENADILYTGKTLTMSFWVKGKYAEGKTITARIGSGGGNTGETTVTLTDSWQYVTTTRKDCYFGGRSDGGVVILSYDTFDDYSGFEIACVKLELGDTATPFEHIPYAEELLMCQKYHMKIEGVNTNSELGLGHFSAISGTTVYPIVYLPTPMRNEPYKSVTPTVTFKASGLELYGCNSARTAYEVRPVTNLSIYAIKDNLVTFKCETDGEFALGTSGDFRIKRNGSQYSIELDAELY